MAERKHKRLNIEQGKVPPQSIELEVVILGAIMLEKTALTIVMEIAKAEVFYKEAHKLIFEAISQLFSKYEPVDILTVTNQLKSNGNLETVGGAYYVTQLTNRIGSTINVEYHTRIILQKFFLREIIRTSSNYIQKAFEDTTDVFDLQDEINADQLKIMRYNEKAPVRLISDVVKEVSDKVEKLRTGEIKYAGIYVELGRFDDIFKGFTAPDVILIAARASMGKTSFMVTLIRKIAMQGIPVGVFSLEMSNEQIIMRLLSQDSGMSFNRIKMGNIDVELMKKSVTTISNLPIYVDDTPSLTITELKSKLFQLKIEHNIQICFVDYIQLMSGTGFNKENEVSNISKGLKAIAKEVNICIIPLSQLSRAVEHRSSRKPQLSDLRDSGSLEQDADGVVFLYRPEYYDIKTNSNGEVIPEGYLEVIVRKNRNGALGTIPLHFNKISMNIESDENIINDLPESEQLTLGNEPPF